MNLRIGLHLKLALTNGLVCLLSAVILELLSRLAGWTPPLTAAQTIWGILGFGVTGFLVGLAVNTGYVRRVRHALEISRVWLLGNLVTRTEDHPGDEIGLLAENMNQLAHQLQNDERDLAELRQREARLADQVRALSILEERNRMARELHDTVKQHIFSLSMIASAISDREKTRNVVVPAEPVVPSELDAMIQQMKTSAQAAQVELSRLIEDLHPASLNERGLAASLNDYTLILGAREHLLIYLDVQGSDTLIPLPVSEALYRVAQEALNNVIQHARATRVNLDLKIIPEQVTLRICDNGVGYDTSQPHRGMGTANMQERLLPVNGRLAIESRIGRGTTVTAEVGLTRSMLPSTFAAVDQNRPSTAIENWSWVGQKLVIPVGQTWPWLPADEVYLLRPLVESSAEALTLRSTPGVFGFGKEIVIQTGPTGAALARIRVTRNGYEWHAEGAPWSLRHVPGMDGNWVLYRNEQPIAAAQHQGRQMQVWNEFIYAGRGYRLSCAGAAKGACGLFDADNQELLHAVREPRLEITLNRAVPLPLLLTAVLRLIDEHTMLPNGSADETNSETTI